MPPGRGRGSSVGSIVCYLTGLSHVDPVEANLSLGRFLNEELASVPDIDLDFPRDIREKLIVAVTKRYGNEHASLVASFATYRSRGAIRDVGKAFGFSEDRIAALSKRQQWWSKGITSADLRSLGFDPDDNRLMACLARIQELHGFPRHLSQHVGGFVITKDHLHDIVPIQNAAMDDRTVVEWDKDDLDALGIYKIDVLALGMLTALRKSFGLI